MKSILIQIINNPSEIFTNNPTSLKIFNCTIVNQSSNPIANFTSGNIKNSILYGSSIFGTADYSNIGSNLSLSGTNIYTINSGHFLDFASGDYSLSPGSPCINTGINTISGYTLPETDLAGNPRIINDIVDIGAYEYQ